MKTIAIMLAFAMPICCCFATAFAGGTSSCCTASESTTVCSQQTVDWLDDLLGPLEEQEEQDSCDGMSCCIKMCSPTQDWVPPLDTIGQDLPTFLIQHAIVDAFVLSDASVRLHPPPLIEFNLLGNSNAPSLRGAVILQV